MNPTIAMLFRRQMRLAVVQALQNASLDVDGVPVDINSPGNWDIQQTEDDALPVIMVRTGQENKVSPTRSGIPQFNTGVGIEVKCVLGSTTAEKAQDDMELLWYQVENLLLTDYTLIRFVQCAESVDSIFDCYSAGQIHLASMAGVFRYVGYEVYDSQQPAQEPDSDLPDLNNQPTVPLTEAGVHFDLVNVADLSGTYPDPAFPDSVKPAPRTEGPDGRDEGFIKINLDQE